MPNHVRSNTVRLVVTMWNNYHINLKILYKAQTPILDFSPLDITIRFCFISYPYKRTITIKNTSNLPGYFFLLKPESDAIQVTAKISEGQIAPYEKVEIPFVITTCSLGEHELAL